MAPRYGIQIEAGDIHPMGGALRVASDTDSTWPVRQWRGGFLPRAGSLCAGRVDPLFIAALLCAIASVTLTWLPRYNVALAGTALIMALLGYQRHFSYKHRGRYRGLWINYLATAIGICGLIAGFGLTAFK
jgi:hypothetical protein